MWNTVSTDAAVDSTAWETADASTALNEFKDSSGELSTALSEEQSDVPTPQVGQY